MSDPIHDPAPQATLPELRFLKWLVTILTATMIMGLLAIVALLVIRFGAADPTPELPASIHLPEGAQAQAVTYADKQIIVLTQQNDILVYAKDGQLTGRTRIKDAP